MLQCCDDDDAAAMLTVLGPAIGDLRIRCHPNNRPNIINGPSDLIHGDCRYVLL